MNREKAIKGKDSKDGCSSSSSKKTPEKLGIESKRRTTTRVVKRPRNFAMDNTDNSQGDYTVAPKKVRVVKKTAEIKTEVATSVVKAHKRSNQKVNRRKEPSSSLDVVVAGLNKLAKLSTEQSDTFTRRQTANLNERKRNAKIIEAFDALRKVLPVFVEAGSRKITRLETLTLTASYVTNLARLSAIASIANKKKNNFAVLVDAFTQT